jgi:hypothetical protein
MRGRDGKIWLGFAKPRNPTVDGFADKPWLRSLTLRLPLAARTMLQRPKRCVLLPECGFEVCSLVFSVKNRKKI